MKYILPFFIFFFSCNSDRSDYKLDEEVFYIDSLNIMADSTNEGLRDVLSDLYVTKKQVQAQIAKFSQENKSLSKTVYYDQPMALSYEYSPSDDKDKQIRELIAELSTLKKENTRLKKIISADSAIKYGNVKPMPDYIDQVPNEEKPNDKSLVITLNRKLRGDGDISEQGISVWIMKYTKKAKKTFKSYESCQQKDLNLLDAKEANYYRGQYFFNDIEPGEYLIKVCALYGNWMVINKKDYKQEIEILMSPPIQ